MTQEIETRICRFLMEAGWGDAQRHPLAGDASARRYERLARGQTRAVLMIAPNMDEEIERFLRIGRWLTENGFSAPQILAQADGLLLLEDLGDDLVARLIAQEPDREAGLYREITDFLLALHARPAPEGLSVLDAQALSNLAQLCGDWYLPAAGREAADFAVPSLIAQAYFALEPVAPVMCLRDFHAENLLWLPERSGTARLGVLDFQDAVAAHPAYDLVSALQDARRDVSTDVERSERARYGATFGGDAAQFELAYALLGAQRSIRILGVFTRLCLAAGKASYVALIPRTWGYIARNLAHPQLGDIKEAFFAAAPAPTDAMLQRMIDQCGTHPMR